MKVSLNWLKRYVDIEESAAVLAHDLTMFGLNVESVETKGPDFSGVVWGKVLTCNRHPAADRLSVCTVDAGRDKPLHIVCGAPNVRAGLSVAVAEIGAVLAGGFKIKKAKLRGEVSEGMICSETELGIGDDASGIIELDFTLTPGESLDGRLGHSDILLDIEITPNRPDLLCHFGIAREIAALYNRELRFPELLKLERGEDFSIRIENGNDCPRYSAAFIDQVEIKPSPEWMQELLLAVGLKPISNIVDITNFVLMETGQPLHAFDRDRLSQDSILVRRARPDEKIVTLDGTERQLNDNVLLITDGERPQGVAGVMGGQESEINPGTKRILLESATFGPRAIRRSRQCLKMDTEASYRFEREADIGVTVEALERACWLIKETGAGQPSLHYADNLMDNSALETRRIELRVAQANRIMGTQLAADDLVELLDRLGLESREAGETVVTAVPTFRRDLKEEIDLIEETSRVYGYENIGREEERKNSLFASISVADRRNEDICFYLASRGYTEVITSSFMDPQDITRFEWSRRDPRGNPVKLENPLTISQSVMRTSLLPGMLKVIGRHPVPDREGMRIFEMAKVFLRIDDSQGLPEEQLHLCGIFTGKTAPLNWAQKQRSFDFFDMKGEMEALFRKLNNYSDIEFVRQKEREPDHICSILINNEKFAECGMIPSRIAGRYEIDLPVFYYIIFMDLFPVQGFSPTRFSYISPYPGVKRDLCVISSDRITFSDIRTVIKKSSKHLEFIRLFDYYRGDHLGEGKRSYTFRLGFRSPENTLDDKVVDGIIDRILDNLQKKLQVSLRTE
ncbi:MAG: phenylalanine--tRNA ligase subunit beta [Candidatus Krumholzibacteriota bacterium]|nr:phenylalanine--tRNA ligase subunit beta [Candidatus Krumholzibacteriota bacterium]